MTINLTVVQRAFNVTVRSRDVVLQTTLLGYWSRQGGGTHDFDRRPSLVTWAAANPVPQGTIAHAGGYAFEFVSLALSEISDLPGWKPHGDATAYHWGENLVPGTTDMAPAITEGFLHYPVLKIRGRNAVASGLGWLDKALIGEKSQGTGCTVLLGLSASIPVNTPILAIGGRSHILNVQIGYDTITGTEARFERVAVGTVSPGGVKLARGSQLMGLTFKNVGTVICDNDIGCFSCAFANWDIIDFSYTTFDFSATGRTGNIYSNIYARSSAYDPMHGILFEGRESGSVWQQINMELFNCRGNVVVMHGCQGASINAFHIEGVGHTGPNLAYFDLEQTDYSGGGFSYANLPMLFDGVQLWLLGDAGYEDDGGAYSAKSATSYINIETLSFKGLAAPDIVAFPSYPLNRRGLDKVLGFKVFARKAGLTDRNYKVRIGHVAYFDYTSTPANEAIELGWDTTSSDSDYIDFIPSAPSGAGSGAFADLTATPTTLTGYGITDGATQTYVNARTPQITVASTSPASPASGDVWIDIS